MAQSRVAAGPSLGQALVWPLRRAAGNVRVTVALSVILIAGSFAAAAGLQMRNDRAHALAEAEHFDRLRAREIALDLSAALNRYESLGAAFANTATSAETSAALSEAGGQALRNIAVLDIRGQLQSELTGSPQSFLPLSPETLEAARLGRAVAPSRDGKSFAIVFGAGPHIVAVELDARALMPSASDEEALLATLDGAVVAVEFGRGTRFPMSKRSASMAAAKPHAWSMWRTDAGSWRSGVSKAGRWRPAHRHGWGLRSMPGMARCRSISSSSSDRPRRRRHSPSSSCANSSGGRGRRKSMKNLARHAARGSASSRAPRRSRETHCARRNGRGANSSPI